MAKLDALKRKANRFGAPPPEAPQEEAIVEAPEVAPPAPAPAVDKRSLRTTGRTHPLATRVTPEFHKRLRQIAARDGLKIVEVLERALAAYERDKQ